MNQARLSSLLEGLSGIALKVYEAVPIAETWTKKQIAAELMRTGVRTDLRIIEGCLASLVDRKLIRERGVGGASGGSFTREAIHTPRPAVEGGDKKATEATRPVMHLASVNKITEKAIEMPAKDKTPIEIIEGLTSYVDGAIKSLQSLRSELDAAAVSIEDMFIDAEKRNEKLNQLQTLLKSLG